MKRHGYASVVELSAASRVGHPTLYRFLNGDGKGGLSVETRRKLVKAFPGDEMALVADIIDAPAVPAS